LWHIQKENINNTAKKPKGKSYEQTRFAILFYIDAKSASTRKGQDAGVD
jgi:hypothetical protein